ncbi:MAG: hypothetical protein JWP63_2422, partial [Candidatus Solibacter sp.]|nr:hypothetical protein [Candidatus Solibacter sp.]
MGEGGDLLAFRPRHLFEEHVAAYREHVLYLWTNGVDAIHLAGYLDSRSLTAALSAAAAVEEKLACRIATMITLDLTPMDTISGERPDTLWEMLRDYGRSAWGSSPAALGRRPFDACTRLPV